MRRRIKFLNSIIKWISVAANKYTISQIVFSYIITSHWITVEQTASCHHKSKFTLYLSLSSSSLPPHLHSICSIGHSPLLRKSWLDEHSSVPCMDKVNASTILYHRAMLSILGEAPFLLRSLSTTLFTGRILETTPSRSTNHSIPILFTSDTDTETLLVHWKWIKLIWKPK